MTKLPPIGEPLKRGMFVRATCGDRTVTAMVTLASPNGRSIVLAFEAILDGHAGFMPLDQLDDGSYRALVTGSPVTIVRIGERMH